jgi:hypothetical protein
MANETPWRTVPQFPDYEVSGQGGVRRRTRGKGTYPGRALRTPIDSEGYPTVNLVGKPRRVHVLVASAFLAGWTPDCEVHHRNEEKSDPRAANLKVAASRLAHFEHHRRKGSNRRRHGEPNPTVACACCCGATFPKFDAGGRPRRFLTGHNLRRPLKTDALSRPSERRSGGQQGRGIAVQGRSGPAEAASSDRGRVLDAGEPTFPQVREAA